MFRNVMPTIVKRSFCAFMMIRYLLKIALVLMKPVRFQTMISAIQR